MKALILLRAADRERACVVLRFSLLLVILLLLLSAKLFSQNSLVYIEGQAVGSYESQSGDLRPYSFDPYESMQKPSLGVDYVQRFGNSSRDFGYLSLQARLAYDENKDSRLEAQLYNAFIDLKTSNFDVWIGHNKPATGLSVELDNHAQLLMDNTMSGLVFDRDWGLGFKFDRQQPNLSISLTTGSGMSLYHDKSWLASARAGIGGFSRDGYSAGMTLAGGNVFKTMGYTIMHDKTAHKLLLGGVDYSRRAANLESRSELLAGTFHDDPAFAALSRLSWFPLAEDRLQIDLQAQLYEIKQAGTRNYSASVSYRISPDLTLRGSYNYQDPADSHVLALQLYYYKGIAF